ncbi:MAG: Holliday junction branch migration protein RuvA [Ignavibacteria bacterium]|jgi:Holliday junction DNA helicase RuvA|nr:Holliday junction branch migration protein RuvA [Ignavibacteria bacterium]MDP3830814.1 Holliday junction branch migration protein RuvA [Ignavibacteriaceae bacterium]
MIGYLSGKLLSAKPTKIIIDVNGVGYLVNISITTFEKITDLKEVSLFIYTSVREDAITLFGFFSENEKEMFELLISVNGIGPKLAQSILSGIQVDELRQAIQSSDITRIVAVPGIGRKTAERLVVELRSKVDSLSGIESGSISSSIRGEAIAALTTLGYNLKTAEKITRDLLTADSKITIEDLIRRALSLLNR